MLNTVLLAETRMAEVSLQYREAATTESFSQWWYLLIPVIAISLAMAIYKIADRPPTILDTPLGMLHELCQAHRIKGSSRAALERVAELAAMEHPAKLFLGPDQFDAAIEKATRRQPLTRRQTQALDLVKRRIFA